MFLFCVSGFIEPWQWVSLVSPLFVIFLLTQISGIPLLEKSANQRYGNREGCFLRELTLDYQAYKAKTSLFFPWPPRHDLNPSN